MLGWIKGIFDTSNIKNPEGVSAHIVGLITTDISRLEKEGNGHAARALQYILNGSEQNIIAELTKPKQTYYFGPLDEEIKQRTVRWQIYEHWDSIPQIVLLRFAIILAASSGRFRHGTDLEVPAQFEFINMLIVDLLNENSSYSYVHQSSKDACPATSMGRLEKLLQFAGAKESDLTVWAFCGGVRQKSWTRSPSYIGRIPGFGKSAARFADLVRGIFRSKEIDERIHVLKLLEHTASEDLAAFAGEIISLSIESSKQVRALAVPLAKALGSGAIALAKKAAVEEKPEQRSLALRLLWELDIEGSREFVLDRAEKDNARSVKKEVELLRDRAVGTITVSEELVIPELDKDLNAPLSAEGKTALRKLLEAERAIAEARNREYENKFHKTQSWMKILTSSAIDEIIEQVAEPASAKKLEVFEFRYIFDDKAFKRWKEWFLRDDVTLTHLVRLLYSVGEIRSAYVGFGYISQRSLAAYGATGRCTLQELHNILADIGADTEKIVVQWFYGYQRLAFASWPAENIWPYFAKNRQIINQALAENAPIAKNYWYSKPRVYEALATFPQIPPDLISTLLDLALGSAKSDRIGAQRALDQLPEKESQIIEGLKSGKSETRVAAANWLGRLRCQEAVPEIEAALGREKNELAMGAMFSALEILGVPLEKFLNRENLEKESEKGLAKGIPADLVWFPFESLPKVHWKDTEKLVPESVIKWFLIQSFKLKSAEPSGLMRRYIESFKKSEREALGIFVLSAWLKQDVLPISRTDAEQRARSSAKALYNSIKQYPLYYEQSGFLNSTEEQIYESQLPSYLQIPAGSAISSKGILAIAAASGGSEIASVVHRFIKEWYGTRAAQGKALIQMLAWVDHPTATQLMLSIGSRFRTKSFQEEATAQAKLLAERRGWTLDELSDRTIPTAGFDENCEMSLNYGSRTFKAQLTPDFEIILLSPEGKKISSLPDARKDEDEATVKEIKKQFSSAKKELKGVLALQSDRLYEALCTERKWRFEDWSLYLNQHPIVRRFCQQLVWRAQSDRKDGEGKETVLFRPLEDGSLTDVTDNGVAFDADAKISLAHDSNTPESVMALWLQHFKDYKVEPLFQQFGKGSYKLPEEKKDSTSIDEFEGHLVQAFSLRGRAGKLGYTRGAAEDGGWFFRYEKRFPTLGLNAVIDFSGSPLPEENRSVALASLTFTRKAPVDSMSGTLSGRDHNAIPLSEVPEVLLSECRNDLRLMAADGTGFDPEWQKKVEY